MAARIDRRRSRYKDPPALKAFVPSDFEICKLFAPGVAVREPWGYQYLPTKYVGPLLNRSVRWAGERTSRLRGVPHYIQLAEQSHNVYQQLIFRLGSGGVNQLKSFGSQVQLKSKPVPHELYSCIFAASIEIGARQHNLAIQITEQIDLPQEPDWPLFVLQGRTVILEFDADTETIETIIKGKYKGYLKLISDRLVKRPIIFFITTNKGRVSNFIKKLQETIDEDDCPHEYAEHFGFAWIEYDRFLNTIPPLSGWAVTTQYQRAGHEPFRFI